MTAALPPGASIWQLALLFFFNGVASCVMTLANKKIALLFPFPCATVLLQNCIVFVICGAYAARTGSPNGSPAKEEESSPVVDPNSTSRRRRSNIVKKSIRQWATFFLQVLPVAVFTSLVLATSLTALRTASVPLIVTFRNLTPLVCALLESVVFGTKFPPRARVGLLLGVFGSWLYTTYEKSRPESSSSSNTNNGGIFFVIANLVLSAVVVILEKLTICEYAKQYSPATVNCMRILAMAPVLVLLGNFVLEEQVFTNVSASTLPFRSEELQDPLLLILFLVTGAFAAVFGISGLTLTKFNVSCTTLAFANTIYKLVTTVAGELFFPSHVAPRAWLGSRIFS